MRCVERLETAKLRMKERKGLELNKKLPLCGVVYGHHRQKAWVRVHVAVMELVKGAWLYMEFNLCLDLERLVFGCWAYLV